MAGYLGLFAAGFRRQSTYRWALAIGMSANVLFGIFRTAVFLTLYRQVDQAGGLDVADALTYVWVLQALFGVVFASSQMEYPESIRSGDFVIDLLRPGDPLARLAVTDAGRSTFVLLARGLPQLLLPGLFIDLRLPTTAGGIVLLAVSFVLCRSPPCSPFPSASPAGATPSKRWPCSCCGCSPWRPRAVRS
jgi:ABC-2 type transport system permease protein